MRTTGWAPVARGLYAQDTSPNLADRLGAWRLALLRTAVFTSLTAAELRGWWLPAPVPHPVFAAVAEQERHPQRRGLRVTRLGEAPVAELVQGLPVASAAETLLAAARDLGLLDLVAMADWALRAGDCTLTDLQALASQPRRGAPALRALLPLVDRRSESPWESILRVLHRAADIEVEPQYEITDDRGRFLARADLWLVGTRRIHEYDGEVHRSVDAHRSDLGRDRRLVEADWQRCGYTSREVLRGGASIIASADAVLGRTWDPARLAAWRALVADSLYGSGGRSRVAQRWRSSKC